MKKKILIISVLVVVLTLGTYFILSNKKENKMLDLSNMSLNEIKDYSKENNLNLKINYEFNKTIEKDKLISQSIKKDKIINADDKLVVVISKGKITNEEYKNNNINELGNVPIMMYHGIENVDTNENVGGNVDKDGYNRTAKAFREDLEFYYKENYRMVRLVDYVNGEIDTEFGKSPLILTFDDGNKNNFNVLGKDEKGNLQIDPNCAIGILEEFKKKYPDYNVTATFFVMDNLFNQEEYDEEKLKWLVDNGYDVGNHTKNHINFKTATIEESVNAVGYMYEKLDKIIPNKYVNIVALPYGSPGSKTHQNFNSILSGTYNNKEYSTQATLRVGWMQEVSPFNKNFDKTFLKRIRAYDNNGKDFDITYTFNQLKNDRYISDGDKDTIVIPTDKESSLGQVDKEIIKY